MYSLQFIERTQQVWQPYYQVPLTREDSQEIASNITALFHLFSDWAVKLEAEKQQ
jgi:hypothetical protein